MNENENINPQEAEAAAPEAAQQSEQFAGVDTAELKSLYDDLKKQTQDLISELNARHAAPDTEQVVDWEGLFDSYRAPYRSGKE